MTRLGFFVLWLLHFLPLALLSRIGQGFGMLLYAFARERRRIARINLRLCFPEMADRPREALGRRHFRAMGRGLLELGILWWSSRERIQRLVKIEGIEHWQAVADQPTIWLVCHFVGLDMGGMRLSTEYPFVTLYRQQRNRFFDKILRRGRTRFGTTTLFSRQDGIRPVVKALRGGLPFYYVTDQDFGAKDALFVPFFGVPAATITGLSRLCSVAGAAVVPCITRQLPGGEGYVLKFYPPWENYPSGDLESDTRRMNAFFEERIREMPEQYFWLHRRFKTRPEGEAAIYK